MEDGKWHNSACCQEQQAQGVSPLHGWQVSPRHTHTSHPASDGITLQSHRDGIRVTSIVAVCISVTRGLSLPPRQDNDLHVAFSATGRSRLPAPPGRELAVGLARSHMTHKLKKNKGARFEPGTGKDAFRKAICSTQA